MKFTVKSSLTLHSLMVCVIIIACNDTPAEDEKTTEAIATPGEYKQLVFDKLVGLWKSEDGNSFEQWTKNEDGTFQSRAFSVKGTDTSWNEQASIYRDDNNWVFENTVKGQNNGKAVKFTSTICNETTVQFSNPQHDFPTDINYTIPDANTIIAFIVGPDAKGGKDTIPFNYSRIK
ncbi:MAG TPA: hypothetical protein VF144_03595 [Chitinophagaceae bacterium]